jgi:hypothetical protein
MSLRNLQGVKRASMAHLQGFGLGSMQLDVSAAQRSNLFWSTANTSRKCMSSFLERPYNVVMKLMLHGTIAGAV